jgi:peptide/nickel transport system substrate-binding protein
VIAAGRAAAAPTRTPSQKGDVGRMAQTHRRRLRAAGLAALTALGLVAPMALPAVIAAATPHHRAQAQNGGTLVIAAAGDALTLDPVLTTDEDSKPVESLLYNSLVTINQKLQFVPDLATRWTVSPDGKTYTFYLRHGVVFHHGGTMTAADVAFSFQRLMNPKVASPWASFFQPVQSIATPNPYEVVVHLSQPYSPFLTAVASFLSVMPASFVNANHGNLTRVEDGTGPYMLQSWVPGNQIVLVKNPHFFIPGVPHFAKIVFKVIPSDQSRIAALEAGQAQFAWFIDPTVGPQLTALASQHRIKLVRSLSTEYHMFGFNTHWGPFKNPLVRLALSYAINRQEILDAAAHGQGMVSGLLTPALESWTLPVKDYPSYTQNIAKAKALLKEAGYPRGFTFHIMSPPAFPVDQSDALIIQQQLKAIGVKAVVDPTEWGTYVHTWVLKTFQSFTGENGDWTDPDLAMYAALHTGGSTNAFQYSNPQVDKLLQEGRAANSQAQRQQIYDQVQRIIVNDGGPMLYLFATYEYMAMAPNVQGYVHIPGAPMWSLQDAYYSR